MAAEMQQISEDLTFLRRAVETRSAVNPVEARLVYGYWAVYVLVGYFLIDVAPAYAGWFFMIFGILGGFVSSAIGRRVATKYGQVSREESRRTMLHWAIGMPLVIVAAMALATVIPALRGPAGSQVLLVMIGLVYYFWGVYIDRNFLWLGPVLMVGGLTVGFIPVYPWTCVGAVIALGLIVPPLLTPAMPTPSAADAA